MRSNRRIALTQVTVANCITSLRTIARLDWKDFVESQSTTERILREDLSGHYAQMLFGTRDHYRHVVEHIAKRTKKPEEEVANVALGLTVQGHGQGDEPRSHVGFYLIDDGRRELEEATGYKPPLSESAYRLDAAPSDCAVLRRHRDCDDPAHASAVPRGSGCHASASESRYFSSR